MWQRTRISPGRDDAASYNFGHSHTDIPRVDPMWRNPNRNHAVQGAIVTVAAVHKRLI